MRTKRFFIMLSATMLLDITNVSATDCAGDEVLGVTTKKCIKASGECGAGCAYTIDASGNLEVTGNGEGTIKADAFRSNKDIVNIDIKGIRTINRAAFYSAGAGGGTVKIDDKLRENTSGFWDSKFAVIDIDSTNFSTAFRSFNTSNMTLKIYPNSKNFAATTFTDSSGGSIPNNVTVECKEEIALCAKSLYGAAGPFFTKNKNLNLTDQDGNSVLWDEEGYSVLNTQQKISAEYDKNGNLLAAYTYGNDGSTSVYNKDGELVSIRGKKIYTVEEAEAVTAHGDKFHVSLTYK